MRGQPLLLLLWLALHMVQGSLEEEFTAEFAATAPDRLVFNEGDLADCLIVARKCVLKGAYVTAWMESLHTMIAQRKC